jgi:hypothetical protein
MGPYRLFTPPPRLAFRNGATRPKSGNKALARNDGGQEHFAYSRLEARWAQRSFRGLGSHPAETAQEM